MSDVFSFFLDALVQTTIWEWLAFVASLLYLYWAANGSILCWAMAAIASFIYIFLSYHVGLNAEILLHIFYLVMAFWGLYSWYKNQKVSEKFYVKEWKIQVHCIFIVFGISLAYIFSLFLESFDSKMPFIDSITTVFGIMCTIMVIKKVLSNWLYWIVINLISIYLYTDRALYLTALLFVIYTLGAIRGYFIWKSKATMASVQ